MWHPVGNENVLCPMASLIDVFNQSESKLSFMLTYGPNRTAITPENIALWEWSQYPRPVSAKQTDTFWFVGYYSHISLPVNYCFQLIGTVVMVIHF